MVRLLAERSDTKSNIKLDGFRPQLQASYVSSHTEELLYNQIVCLWMTIYIYEVTFDLISIIIRNEHNETDYISHSVNTFGKDMYPTIFPPAMGK